MKETTLHSLVTARALFEHARGLCSADDRHVATAGLVVIQDSLEIVFLSLLIEMGIDEVKSLESHTFDQLIGDLKSEGVKVPKSGTLKALNKHRVLAKHYGQLAEPTTVRGYLDAADTALNSVLMQVVGKNLQEIFLTDLIEEGESRQCLEAALRLMADGHFLEALIEIRKAIFIEIENDYSVYEWRDEQEGMGGGALSFLFRGGQNAPYYKRNKNWISKNVKCPTDYIQMDYERLRLDAMEWGVNTAELQNIRRLTPEVFRQNNKSKWSTKYHASFPANEANIQNARYCLDRTIAAVLKKQTHERVVRYARRGEYVDLPAVYLGDFMYERASIKSDVIHAICDEYEYVIYNILTGLDGKQVFLFVSGSSKAKDENQYPTGWIGGYLVKREEGTS